MAHLRGAVFGQLKKLVEMVQNDGYKHPHKIQCRCLVTSASPQGICTKTEGEGVAGRLVKNKGSSFGKLFRKLSVDGTDRTI